MAEVEIAYKGSLIASMDATGSKTLTTSGKYCEDDIAVYYSRPSGGSNTPVAEATITSVTESGNDRSFDVTLSRTITKGVVLFEADAATEAAIRADTSTTYYTLSFFAMYPVTGIASGSSTLAKNVNATAYRGSASAVHIRSVQTSQFNIAVNGTTMTVTWNGGIVGNVFPSGTYKVTVWEIADS